MKNWSACAILPALGLLLVLTGGCVENNDPKKQLNPPASDNGVADDDNDDDDGGGEPLDTDPPTFGGVDAIENLTATSFLVVWRAADDDTTSAGEIRYSVYVGNQPSDLALIEASAIATGVTYRWMEDLDPDTQYCLLVRAEDGSGNLDGNNEQLCVITPDDTEAPAFDGIASASLSQADPPEITVGWAEAADDNSTPAAISYRVYRAEVPGAQDFAVPLAEVTGASAYVDESGLPNETYFYAVRAVDQAGNEDSNAEELSVSTPFDSSGFSYVYHPGLQDLAYMGAAVALVDWNADGDADAAVGAYNTGNPGVGAAAALRAGQVSIYLGDGAGAFESDPAVQFYSPNTVNSGAFGISLAACDISGDGTADDLVVGASAELRVYIYIAGAGGQDTVPDRVIAAPVAQGDTDNFGEALACGNFNGTGGDDLIVGAPRSDDNGSPDSGTLYFYNNNSVPPLIDIAGPNSSYRIYPQDNFSAQIVDAQAPQCAQGMALSDFDGDGQVDLAVGCPFADVPVVGGNDGVVVFYSRPDRTDANTWVTRGLVQPPNTFDGWAWSLAAGNLDDADPGMELAIGQRYYDSPGTNAGAVFLYDVSYLTGPPRFALSSPWLLIPDRGPNGAQSNFGAAVAQGDADGDGAADLLVGAPEEDFEYLLGNSAANLGAFYYFAGTPGGRIDALAEKSDFNTYARSDGSPVHGGTFDVQFGRAVCVGDIDNDGRPDLLVGAENDPSDGKTGGTGTGRVYVWYSVASGEIDLAGEPDAWFRAPGLVLGKRFGTSCVVMDYNGDDLNDVVIGAQYADDNAGDQGAVYVYLGVDSPNTGGPDTGSVPVDETPDLTLFVPLLPAGISHYFGSALAACDLTGDGFPELIVGSRLFDGTTAVSGTVRGSTDEGAVFVFRGSAAGVVATNWQAIFPTDLNLGLSSYGASAYSDNQFGYAVGCFPAASGSAAMDLVVGSPYATKPSGGDVNQGMVTIFLGAVNQDPAGGGKSCSGNNEYVGTVCMFDDRQDIRIDDQGPIFTHWALFGSAIAVGNWDGAGGNDLVIGAAWARRPAPEPDQNGGVYVLRGGTTGGFVDLSAGVPLAAYYLLNPTNVTGTLFADGAVTLGDLNNNGIPELIVGANRCSYNDTVRGHRGAWTGCVYVDRGDYRP